MFPNIKFLCVFKRISVVFIFLTISFHANSDAMLAKKDIILLEKNNDIKKLECTSYYESYAQESKSFIHKNIDFDIKEDFFKSKRVFDGSKLICLFDVDVLKKRKTEVRVKEEALVDGVKVSFYHWGGSGTIGESYDDKSAWNIGCSVDSMTDKLTCYISKDNFYLYRDVSGYTIVVGSEHFPNTLSYIRREKYKPFESDSYGIFKLDDSKEIIEAISSGDKIVTRYTKWPYDSPLNNELDTNYFKSSVKILDVIYKSHK